MRGYAKTSRGSGYGIFRSADGTKSVKAFYEFFDAEPYAGNKDRIAMPGYRRVRTMDCRDKDNNRITTPEWLRGETTHEADDRKSYRVSYGSDGVWYFSLITDSEGK
jgi:hypothetical protein